MCPAQLTSAEHRTARSWSVTTKKRPIHLPYRAYVIDNGVFTGFTHPNIGKHPITGNDLYCAAWDISPDGSTIVGTYFETLTKSHGFVAERRGASVADWDFTTIDFPGTNVTSTTVHGGNPAGDLVGRYTYTDAQGVSTTRPFLASRSGGK